MKNVKILSTVSIVAGLMLAPAAFAGVVPANIDVEPSAVTGEVTTSVGLGIGMAPDYEGSEDYEAVALPFANVRWGNDGNYVLLAGNKLRANLLSEQWQLGPLLQYRKERDSVDNSRVKRMKDIDAATEAGLFMAYKSGPWRVGVDAVADISDEHDGYLVTLRGAYTCDKVENMKITTTLSSTYADDDYMETYFQVDANNVGTSGLRLRDADSGIKDVGLSLVGDYSLNKNWSVMGIASYTQLLSDAKDSPVVKDEGDDGQMFFGLLGVYHFD